MRYLVTINGWCDGEFYGEASIHDSLEVALSEINFLNECNLERRLFEVGREIPVELVEESIPRKPEIVKRYRVKE